MKTYTLDTNIISYLMKGTHKINESLTDLIEAGDQIVINPISYYEICRGLIAINATKKLDQFKNMCDVFGIPEINRDVLDNAAQIYSELKAKGELIEDADILIAAICLSNNYVLATNNAKHFKKINGLVVENWVDNHT